MIIVMKITMKTMSWTTLKSFHCNRGPGQLGKVVVRAFQMKDNGDDDDDDDDDDDNDDENDDGDAN